MLTPSRLSAPSPNNGIGHLIIEEYRPKQEQHNDAFGSKTRKESERVDPSPTTNYPRAPPLFVVFPPSFLSCIAATTQEIVQGKREIVISGGRWNNRYAAALIASLKICIAARKMLQIATIPRGVDSRNFRIPSFLKCNPQTMKDFSEFPGILPVVAAAIAAPLTKFRETLKSPSSFER